MGTEATMTFTMMSKVFGCVWRKDMPKLRDEDFTRASPQLLLSFAVVGFDFDHFHRRSGSSKSLSLPMSRMACTQQNPLICGDMSSADSNHLPISNRYKLTQRSRMRGNI